MTQEELKDWIKFTQTRYIMNDVHSQWDTHKLQDDGKLSWMLYRKDTYGFMTGENCIINIYFIIVHYIIYLITFYKIVDTKYVKRHSSSNLN